MPTSKAPERLVAQAAAPLAVHHRTPARFVFRHNEGLIVEHWIQWDMKVVVDKSTN
jgi:hypothetical protein